LKNVYCRKSCFSILVFHAKDQSNYAVWFVYFLFIYLFLFNASYWAQPQMSCIRGLLDCVLVFVEVALTVALMFYFCWVYIAMFANLSEKFFLFSNTKTHFYGNIYQTIHFSKTKQNSHFRKLSKPNYRNISILIFRN